jgi:hypothetical protein
MVRKNGVTNWGLKRQAHRSCLRWICFALPNLRSLGFTPYEAIPSNIPLNELTQATASTSKIEKTWQKASMKMFAVRPKQPDRQDENLLNRAIWYSAFNFRRPYPGDSKILSPQEVTVRFGKERGERE